MLRRSLFGLFWFALFWMAIAVVGGGLADSTTSVHAASAPVNVQTGQSPIAGTGSAAAKFHQRHGLVIVFGAAILALSGTFAGLLPGTRR